MRNTPANRRLALAAASLCLAAGIAGFSLYWFVPGHALAALVAGHALVLTFFPLMKLFFGMVDREKERKARSDDAGAS